MFLRVGGEKNIAMMRIMIEDHSRPSHSCLLLLFSDAELKKRKEASAENCSALNILNIWQLLDQPRTRKTMTSSGDRLLQRCSVVSLKRFGKDVSIRTCGKQRKCAFTCRQRHLSILVEYEVYILFYSVCMLTCFVLLDVCNVWLRLSFCHSAATEQNIDPE